MSNFSAEYRIGDCVRLFDHSRYRVDTQVCLGSMHFDGPAGFALGDTPVLVIARMIEPCSKLPITVVLCGVMIVWVYAQELKPVERLST